MCRHLPSSRFSAPTFMLSPRAQQIRQMFSSIAHRYDFLNHVLSFNIDKAWRRRAVRIISNELSHQRSLCLDLCCGTGDLCLEMSRLGPARIVASDFSHPMLRLNRVKTQQLAVGPRLEITEADALNLPFRDSSFNALGIAFGLRNLENPMRGLSEMLRVLKPGGKIVVLEFSKPTNACFDRLFQFYFFNVLPKIGRFFSKHDQAYSYLPASVSQFPTQRELCQIMAHCGFENVSYVNLSGGIAALHYGQKRNEPPAW
jgi:demethylmenaquinone methyltransferase / 2-methoxy-6-polyprenyl-1,4-benzoquinol methylase